MALRVRLAVEADLPAVNAIYNHYVQHSVCTFALAPVTAEERESWFAHHDARHPVTVSVDGEVIVGWASLNVYNVREAYARTGENSIYVHPDHHRRGIGRLLLSDTIDRARALGYHTIIAGISGGQEASMALHQSFGFVECGHFAQMGWKLGGWVDVIYLQKMLDPEVPVDGHA